MACQNVSTEGMATVILELVDRITSLTRRVECQYNTINAATTQNNRVRACVREYIALFETVSDRLSSNEKMARMLIDLERILNMDMDRSDDKEKQQG